MSAKEGMGAKPGDRVFAATHADADSIYFLGFGKYEGDFVPSEDAVGTAAFILRMRKHENPKIVLDDGDEIFGCECYWGPADQLRSFASMRKIIQTTVSDFRESVKPKKKSEA